MRELVIVGAGKMAELLAVSFAEDYQREVSAFCVDDAYLDSPVCLGKPVLPFSALTQRCPPSRCDLIVAIGYAELNRTRARKLREAEALGYTILSYVSPRACVPADFSPGPNVIIFENVTLQRLATLGRNIVIWPGAFIGHHCIVRDDVFIGPNATLCGGTRIGSGCLLGAASLVRDYVTVGDNAIVGAGSVLLRDLPDSALCHAGESAVILNKTPGMTVWPPHTVRLG